MSKSFLQPDRIKLQSDGLARGARPHKVSASAMYSVVQMPNQVKPQDVAAPRTGRWAVRGRPPGGRVGLDDADRPAAGGRRMGAPASVGRLVAVHRGISAFPAQPVSCVHMRSWIVERSAVARRPPPISTSERRWRRWRSTCSRCCGTRASACSWPTAPARSFTPLTPGRTLVRWAGVSFGSARAGTNALIGNNGLGTAAVLREPVAFEGKRAFLPGAASFRDGRTSAFRS